MFCVMVGNWKGNKYQNWQIQIFDKSIKRLISIDQNRRNIYEFYWNKIKLILNAILMIMDHVKFVNFQIKMEFDRLFSKLTLNMACFFFHLLVARQRILGCCNFVCDGWTTLGNIWSSRIFCNIKFVKEVFRELVS